MILKDDYIKEYPNVENLDAEFKDDIFNKMTNIIPDKNNLSDKQMVFLKETSDVFDKLDRLLAVFNKYDIKYTLGLAGGAIRDFVMDKVELINDFDICINFDEFIGINSYIKQNKNHPNEMLHEKMNKICSVFFPHEIIGTIDSALLSKLVNKVIEQEYKTNLFLSDSCAVGDYQNDHIVGIIKISDQKLSKPIDLIISKDSTSIFCTTFSFDICKGFIEYTPELKIKLKEHNGFLNLIDNIILSKHMINDIVNKKYTMNIQHVEISHIHYYMNKHYLKMKEKYPDFKLNYRINKATDDSSELMRLESVEKLALFYMMVKESTQNNPKKKL
jgi:hypothetical protein